jgi:hypothetical protein
MHTHTHIRTAAAESPGTGVGPWVGRPTAAAKRRQRRRRHRGSRRQPRGGLVLQQTTPRPRSLPRFSLRIAGCACCVRRACSRAARGRMAAPPPAPVAGVIGADGWATYGVAQRHSRKQEDRFMVTAQAPWADFVAAVLDGHNGQRAAETCAVRLVAVVGEELARLAPGGAELDAHADASSPNWHPQARVGARRQREAASASQFGPSHTGCCSTACAAPSAPRCACWDEHA